MSLPEQATITPRLSRRAVLAGTAVLAAACVCRPAGAEPRVHSAPAPSDGLFPADVLYPGGMIMVYERQRWASGPAGGTPLSAARLNHIESGIADAHQLAGGILLDSFPGGDDEKSDRGHRRSETHGGHAPDRARRAEPRVQPDARALLGLEADRSPTLRAEEPRARRWRLRPVSDHLGRQDRVGPVVVVDFPRARRVRRLHGRFRDSG